MTYPDEEIKERHDAMLTLLKECRAYVMLIQSQARQAIHSGNCTDMHSAHEMNIFAGHTISRIGQFV